MTKAIPFLLLITLLLIPVISAETLYVNETGWYRSGAAFNTTGTPIQYAIDNASSYDTVYVWNGSYIENIDISTTHLTVQGEGQDVVTVTAAIPTDHVFHIKTNYTNITGLHLTGATDPYNAGVYIYTNIVSQTCRHNNISYNNCSNNNIGIYMEQVHNTTLIGNIANSNSMYGIKSGHTSGDIINNNVASHNGKFGISLSSAHTTTVSNNSANSNNEDGIYMYSSCAGSVLLDNTASLNTQHGIYMRSCNSIVLTNNNASLNSRYGIHLYSSSHNNTLSDNIANSNSIHGIYLLESCNNNTLINNTAHLNTNDGIYLYSSSNNNITGNNASNNDAIGIYLKVSCNNNTITNNIAKSCGVTGIGLYSSIDNIITNNTVDSNSYYGISLTLSSTNYFTSNTANLNGMYGISTYISCNNTFEEQIALSNLQYDFYTHLNSTNNTLLNCNFSSTKSMMNDSTSEWIIKYTTNNITDFNDTTLNQTISPTNVTTHIQPTVDNYDKTITTLEDFTATTDVGTAELQLVEFVSGGHSNFHTSSDNASCVVTYNIGTFTAGSPVQMCTNQVRTATVMANTAGIATFVYGAGFSEHEFDINPSINITLNDTTNYTYTVDAYNSTTFTSTINVTWNGNGGKCAVSAEMPLIITSGYTGLSYGATNVSTAVKISNVSGWAFCNFTLSPTAVGSTYVDIAPSPSEDISHLPAAVVTAIAAGSITTIIYLYRRRR